MGHVTALIQPAREVFATGGILKNIIEGNNGSFKSLIVLYINYTYNICGLPYFTSILKKKSANNSYFQITGNKCI